MEKFLELLRESVIVSGLIALSCVGAVVYLSVAGQPIPELLVNITMIIIGFFFGGKVQSSAERIARMGGRF